MNQFEFVIALVFIVAMFSFLKARAGVSRRRQVRDSSEDSEETVRLREEVKTLKERLHVLERIAVDKENSLAREIEELRNR